ncbi:MAG: 5'-3' exonuclease H3TH domain-containing protein [Actinomycetales bacterium]
MPDTRKLMLLDSASLYFRAFFGVPDSFKAPDGTQVNAVRGFLDMIATLVTMRRPQRLVACWDEDWRPEFRVAAVPSYKTHRLASGSTVAEIVPAALEIQVPIIVDLLAALGIARVGCPGYEADDVIGALAERAAAAGDGPVEVVTGDRDLFQLVDDARQVTVLYVGRGVRNLEVVDEKWLERRYGVGSGRAYADLATLRGDPSDGLPGVAGVGEKSAAGLLTKFPDLVAVRAAAAAGDPRIAPGLAKKIMAAEDYLEAAAVVVQVARAAPVVELDDALPAEPADVPRLAELADQWGVRSSVNRVLAALQA